MSTTSAAIYISKVNEIYNEQPSYQLGHDGSDGTCDCIGMCRGALVRAGVTDITNMRGTNAAARKTIQNFREFSSASELKVGEVVLKAREPGDAGYDLPAAYQPGGSSYNGDLRDYCHIGTVTKVNPLEITHMTSPSAKKDTNVGKWRFHGNLPWVAEGPDPDPDPPQPTPPEPQTDKAVVYADNGEPVKMRAKPSSNCKLYWNVPCGTILDVLDWGDTWSHVRGQTEDGYKTGYMMKKFLKPIGDSVPVDTTYTVCIPGLTEATAQKIVSAYDGAWMIQEGGDGNAVG